MSRREEAAWEEFPLPETGGAAPERRILEDADPEQQAVLSDAVGTALLVVLETLGPAERLAFVLHDLFAVPYADIATVLGKSPAAARHAFLAASREGDFAALLTLLDPDVVLRADGAAASLGAEAEVIGAQAVARTFSGRAKVARLAVVDGAAEAVWAPGGKPRVVFRFTVLGGRVTGSIYWPTLRRSPRSASSTRVPAGSRASHRPRDAPMRCRHRNTPCASALAQRDKTCAASRWTSRGRSAPCPRGVPP